GDPRKPKCELPFDCLQQYTVDADSKRFADIAASVQALYEEIVVGLATNLYEKTQSTNLCIAGGGALNCVANQKVITKTPFTSLYIPIDPGDGGAAAGAALLAYHEGRVSRHQSSLKFTPFVGATDGAAE